MLNALVEYIETNGQSPPFQDLIGHIATFAYVMELDWLWQNVVVESTDSDGLVKRTSQHYQNSVAQYHADFVSHMEGRDHPNVLTALSDALNIYGPQPPITPIISHFTQNPNPMCAYSSSNVYVHLSQGNGNLQYTWSDEGSLPPGSYITPHGNYCTVYLTAGSSSDGPVKNLKCTVTNGAGQSVAVHNLLVNSNCTGCPSLSFDNAGQLTDENPLLITSLSNPGIDVTDYYLINSDVTPINNQIKFTIHEPQTEHSWIDNVELIETRIRENEYVAVTDDGEVVNYKKPRLPLRMMLNDTLDITGLLADLDGDMVSVKAGDYILVNLVTSTSKGES